MTKAEQDNEFAHLIYLGPELTFTQPSSRIITIREYNAADEDIMSKKGNINDGASVHNFIASVVVKDNTTGTRPTVEDIEKWGIKDKYYTLLKIRIHTLGNKMKFHHACNNAKCDFVTEQASPWVEDLNDFDWDLNLTKPPKDTEPGYNKKLSNYVITKYAQGLALEVTVTLSSGKILKYNILDSNGEKFILSIPDNLQVKSDGLRARNLQLYHKNEWLPIKSFSLFSAKDSLELWDSIMANDNAFMVVSEITCPKCQMRELLNLMTHPSFFAQAGI